MSFKNTLLTAALASLPVLAQAQPISGLYLGGGAGANWLQNTTLNGAVNNTLGRTGE
jgi:hypothetical protein